MSAVIDRIMQIDGMTSREEIEQLYELASKAQHGIVEIGSWRGRSTVALALGSLAGNSVPVYAIDPHDDAHMVAETSEFHFKASDRVHFMLNVIEHNVAHIVRLINLPSRYVKLPTNVDLLFIDGDHNRPLEDFEWFKHNLVSGGTVLFHDNNEKETRHALDILDIDGYERLPDVALTARLVKPTRE